MSTTAQAYLVEVEHSGKSSYDALHQEASAAMTNSENGESLCNQMENRSSQAVHTSFPVNLKEVFELTSPSSEINSPLLRSGNEPESPEIEYNVAVPFVQKHRDPMPNGHKQEEDVIPKLPDHGELCNNEADQSTIQNSFMWKSVQSKSSTTPSPSPHGPWSNSMKPVEDEKMNSHSVINLSLGNERIPYRPSHLEMGSTEPNETTNMNQHQSWPQIVEENSNEEQVNEERMANNIINDVCINDYPTHSKLPRESPFHEHDQPVNANHYAPWNFSSDRSRSILHSIPDTPSQSTFATRDASCQVDDTSLSPKNDTEYQSHPMPLTKQSASASERSIAHSMLSLSGESDSVLNAVPHGLVHDGIKPELYTQERNLIIEPRLKELTAARKSGTFHCHRCSKVFSDSRSLQRHIHNHAGARAYHCPVCNKGFMLKGDLTRHIRIHSGEKPFACDVCHRRFTLKGNLMQHFRTHTPEKQYACTICAKNYAQKDSLHRHIRAHFGDKPFQCSICSKRFTLKGDLSRHILIHSGVKPHSCKYCGRMFALKGNLTQHIRIHIKSKTSDPDCSSKNFNDQHRSEGFRNHAFQQNHTQLPRLQPPNISVPNNGENAVSLSTNSFLPSNASSDCDSQLQSSGLAFCSACSKTFTSPESLQEHVRLTHEQPTRLSINRYICAVCTKEFTLKGDLTRHLNSHNGIKPYQCDQCKKTFTLKSNLRQHQTTHVSDKSYPCPLCGKLFGNRRNLSLHLRRHEQASANFTCTRCGRSFLAKSDHFFHNCAKGDVSSNDSSHNSPVDGASVPTTAAYHPPPASESAGNSEPSQPTANNSSEAFEVKREISQVTCNTRDAIPNHENLPSNIGCLNGGDAFLSPFYRHLYFATSHQAVLPSLKGLLHSQTEENNCLSYNKIVKES